MKKFSDNKDSKGFMVVEALVALSIITVSVLAAMSVAQKSIYVARQSFHATQASFLLEEGAEALRLLRDTSWSNISSLTPGVNYYIDFSGSVLNMPTTARTVGIFTRTASVANVNRDNVTKDIASTGTNDPGTKLVTITVSWPEEGVTVTKTMQFYLMNIFP